MAARNPSSSSYELRTLITMLCRYRVTSVANSWRAHRNLQPYNLGPVGSNQGLRFLCVSSSDKHKLEMENGDSREVAQSATPAPPKFGFSNWVKFYLGSIISLLLPLWTNKTGEMLMLGKVEKIVEEVEVAAAVVEKVATTADNVFSEVAKQLPDDSKLKEVAEAMEAVSGFTAHEAHLVEDIIHKVGDVKQDLEELETMVEKGIKGKTPKPVEKGIK